MNIYKQYVRESDKYKKVYLYRSKSGRERWCVNLGTTSKSFSTELQAFDALKFYQKNRYMIVDLNHINRRSPEGKMLFAAIAKITTESQTDKTPNQVIGQLNELSKKMDF